MTVIRGLNLGCGSDVIPSGPGAHWVNADISPALGAYVVAHNLEVFPWPWSDGAFNKALAKDVFEHISPRAVVSFKTECHRVLESGGELHLRVPDWRHENAYTDPTHFRVCTPRTFDYWISGTEFHGKYNAAYGGVSFLLAETGEDGHGNLVFTLVKP